MTTALLAQFQSQFLGFLMVFARVGSMLMIAPVFGSSQIPAQIRIATVLILSLVVFSGLGFPALESVQGAWWVGLAGEFVMGLGVGLLGTMLVSAVQMGGQIIGMQMGFGIVNVIDPMSNVRVSLLGQFKFFVAILVFLAINGHHHILLALNRSFAFAPPGQIVARAAMGSFVIEAASSLFDVAFRIAAPMVVSLLVVSFAFGIISRTVPQINFMIAGFAFKIVVGLFILLAGLATYVEVMEGLFQELPQRFLEFMRLFAP